MLIRPWPIVILALCYLLAPIGNALISSGMMGTRLDHYFSLILQKKGPLEVALIFGIYPICAYAIWSMKRWSYAVFLGVMAFSLFRNYQAFSHYPQMVTLTWLVGLYVVNLALVSYFLIPAVRAPYFNPRLRWWEAKPRYKVQLTAALQQLSNPAPDGSSNDSGNTPQKCELFPVGNCTVLDISEGGLFIETRHNYELGSLLMVDLSILNHRIQLVGKILHSRKGTTPEETGYGLKFESHAAASPRAIKKLVQALRAMGAQTRTQRPDLIQDFRKWAGQLVRTGKGLVPENRVPSPAPVAAAQTHSKDSDQNAA